MKATQDPVHLWKFWMWEVILTLMLLGLMVGALLVAPELATVVGRWQIEVQLLAVFPVMGVSVLAYRIATGALVGAVKWLMGLLGSGVVVAFVTLVPIILFKSVLKPEYLDLTSPFVALFVIWCFYGVIFFVRWQTRLFYRVAGQLR